MAMSATETFFSRQLLLAAILILLLSACGSPTPPTELAPDGKIVTKALNLFLTQTEASLADNLQTQAPQYSLSGIQVKKLEPIYIGKLPAYHLSGTYNLIFKSTPQQVTQKNNPFDIYLQRQREGKSWRLLKRDPDASENSLKWFSYLIW